MHLPFNFFLDKLSTVIFYILYYLKTKNGFVFKNLLAKLYVLLIIGILKVGDLFFA